MKKLIKPLAMTVFSIAQLFLFSACQDDDTLLTKQDEQVLMEEIQKVSPDGDAVTAHDAATVALKKLDRGSLKGRAASNYTISTVEDENGETALYIVNFENNGGFVVVSAKREVEPVLAWNTTGQYVCTEDNGVKIWQDNAVKAIQYAEDQEDSVKQFNKHVWASMTNEQSQVGIMPMAQNASDEWTTAQQILREKLMEWKNDGVDCYALKYWEPRLQHYGPEKTYYKFNWEDCAFVTLRDSLVTRKTEFIKTKWYQTGGFNKYCPEINGEKAVAGCVPVAAGQLMYHYKFPSKYDWNNMALNYATDASAFLLADLGNGMNAKYGLKKTGASIENCMKYLKKLGYSCRDEENLSNSVCDKIEQSMLAQKPILLQLESDGLHLIVVGGVHIHETYVTDEIWSFSTATKYEIVATERTYTSKLVYFFLNWGWGGTNDGFYKLNNITTNESGKTETWKASHAIFVEPNN